ncbi:MAG TPA: hypothetical protein VEI74_07835 [Candidatus Methylomirabilis sp.]|nr:hypothetical protein [Candidatus Methylomirabilis sp.]
MRHDIDFRRFAYLVIILGGVLSFLIAVTPFYGAGYTLRLDILLMGLLPYVVYGLFTDVVRGWALLIAGALILGIDLGVKIPWRFVHHDGDTENILYYASLVSSFIVLPVILGLGARREKRWCGEPPEENPGPHGPSPPA